MGRTGPIGNTRSVVRRGLPPDLTMPEGLGKEARLEWDRVLGLLQSRNVVDGLDQAALQDYLTCWDRVRECERDISERGVLVKGYRGVLAKNPSIQICRTYRQSLLAWCKEFGFSPQSRARINMPQPLTPKQAAENSKWAQTFPDYRFDDLEEPFS